MEEDATPGAEEAAAPAKTPREAAKTKAPPGRIDEEGVRRTGSLSRASNQAVVADNLANLAHSLADELSRWIHEAENRASEDLSVVGQWHLSP